VLAASALTALLTLSALPQGQAAGSTIFDRLSRVAASVFGGDEESRYYLKFGGITRGAGLSLGPGVRARGLAGGRLDAHALVSVSHRKYFLAEASLGAPLAADRLEVGVFARRRYFPQQDFFGIGGASARQDRVSYTYDENAGGIFATMMPWLPADAPPPLTIEGRLEYRHPDVGPGHDAALPSIEERFLPQATPGLAMQPDFLVGSLSADVSLATPAGRPRRGGRYLASLSRFADRGGARYAFNLAEADLRQYVPIGSDRHVLVFRASGAFTTTSGQNEVPFYYLPTLGGGSSLRGFRDFRFHDRHILLLQGEYRWFFSRFVDAAVFYDTGTVARRFSELADSEWLGNYGIGLRVGSDTRVFARVDLALGGREGKRVFLKFSNVF
jgi:hypothetical protein